MFNKNLALWLTITVAALGQLVDAYDIVLFSILRTPSLTALGLSGDQLVSEGVWLLNIQLTGMLLGSILWGILGDKLGRTSVLFGSILLYSIANIANGFVDSMYSYALWRFIAGLGLAGETGAAITLVSEISDRKVRGYTVVIVAAAGACGVIIAALTATIFNWRTMYITGGSAGLVLLALRFICLESGLFKALTEKKIPKGSVTLLFSNGNRIKRYFLTFLPAVPLWFIIGVMLTFSPELGTALNIPQPISAGTTTMFFSAGLMIGDLCAGFFMQWLKSSRKVMMAMAFLAAGLCFLILNLPGISSELFYGLMGAMGFALGYWSIFLISTAEQFGTNLRATVVTTIPNFIRALAIPCTLAFSSLKPFLGVIDAIQVIGLIVFALALWGIYSRTETFARDLDFVEEAAK